MLRRLREFSQANLEWTVTTLFWVLVILLFSTGCQPTKNGLSSATQAHNQEIVLIERTGAFVETAQMGLDQLVPYVVQAGEPIVKFMKSVLDRAAIEQASIRLASEKTSEKIQQLGQESSSWQRKHDELKNHLVTRIAFAIWHGIIWLSILWVASGIAGAFMTGLTGGTGVIGWVGKSLLSFLPFANLFSGLSRKLEVTKG